MSNERPVADDIAAINRISAIPTILQVVARTTGMRFVAIARVTDSTWTTCAVYDQIDFGLRPGSELVLESTICNEIRQHHQPVIFGHASADPHFSTHTTPKLYGFESYISVPIFRSDGRFFGTLCAIDPLPAKLDDPNIVKTIELFTQLISAQLDIEERLEQSDTALIDAKETAALREQFVAVLGHDLRNSLQSIGFCAELLGNAAADARSLKLLGSIKLSCGRMNELIRNMLDFARARLGGGIPAEIEYEKDIGKELRHVIAEVRMAHPGRVIDESFAVKHAVYCDRGRIGQLLSNLLANAVAHGAADQPVSVEVRSDDKVLEISVTNIGQPIPTDKMHLLFKPFSRFAPMTAQSGLGLGLYISAEITKAHRGTLDVTSTEQGTRFVFCMPVSNKPQQESQAEDERLAC